MFGEMFESDGNTREAVKILDILVCSRDWRLKKKKIGIGFVMVSFDQVGHVTWKDEPRSPWRNEFLWYIHFFTKIFVQVVIRDCLFRIFSFEWKSFDRNRTKIVESIEKFAKWWKNPKLFWKKWNIFEKKQSPFLNSNEYSKTMQTSFQKS